MRRMAARAWCWPLAGAGAAARPGPPGRRRRRPARAAGACRSCWRAPSPSSTARSRAARSCCSTRSSSRLESLRRQGALPAARRARSWSRPTSCAAARTTTSACRRRRPTASARSCSSSPQYTLSKDKVSPKIVDYFNSVKKALVGYLAVSSQPAGRARLAERRVPGPHRLLPAGRAGRRVHGRDLARGLPDGDADAEHRARRPPRPCRSSWCARWPARSSSPSRPGWRSGSTASCAPPPRARSPPELARCRARQGARSRARLRRASRSPTSRSART